MAVTDLGTLVLLPCNAEARATEDDVDIHTVDTNVGVVLEVEIDVFLDTETEVTSVGEVGALEGHVLDSETLLEDLASELTAESDVSRDGFVTADVERTDGDAS